MKKLLLIIIFLWLSACQNNLQNFDKYGINFSISSELKLSEYFISENGEIIKPGTANFDRGLIGSSDLEFSLSWLKSPELEEMYFDTILKNLLNVFNYHPELSAEIIGARKEILISNYKVNYANIILTQEGTQQKGIVAFWYCTNSKRLFNYTLLHNRPLEEMSRFLNAFESYPNTMSSKQIKFFNMPIGTNIIIILTILYFFVAAITTFDMRINQAIKQGADFIPLPKWLALFYWLMWAFWIWIFILNWYYAIILFVIKFVLKVLPVLETIGRILLKPFNPNKISGI